MKNIERIMIRKHGRKLGTGAVASRFHLQVERDTREAGSPGERLRTTVTFETDSRVYLWVTDRGRSRLIKH